MVEVRAAFEAVRRIRGRRLQAIRKRVLQAEPLCRECAKQGRAILAVHVDHIDALMNGGVEDPHDDSNRQPLCDECHEVKTVADKGTKPKGADASGWPADPRHPWNLGAKR